MSKASILVEKICSSPLFSPKDHLYFKSQMKNKEGREGREKQRENYGALTYLKNMLFETWNFPKHII